MIDCVCYFYETMYVCLHFYHCIDYLDHCVDHRRGAIGFVIAGAGGQAA